MLPTLDRVGQRVEEFQARRQVTGGFGVGRTLGRALSGPLPVRNRRLGQSGCGVVVRDQLGPGLHGLGKTVFQGQGNLAVISLAPALEQGLIGTLLDQGLAEGVMGLGREAVVRQQVCIDQAGEFCLQPVFRQG